VKKWPSLWRNAVHFYGKTTDCAGTNSSERGLPNASQTMIPFGDDGQARTWAVRSAKLPYKRATR
jgi:hypothetical protein